MKHKFHSTKKPSLRERSRKKEWERCPRGVTKSSNKAPLECWRAKRYACIPLNSEPFLRSNTLLWPHYHSRKEEEEKNFFRRRRSLPKWVWCYEHRQAAHVDVARLTKWKKRGVSERKKEIFYINIGNGPRDSKTTLFDWLAISFTQFIYVQTHEWKEKAQPCAFSQKVSNLFSLSKSKQKGERVREKKLKNAQTMNLLIIIIIIIGSITLKITSTLSLQITITLARWW